MILDYKWKIFFKPKGLEDLKKLPKKVQKRIVEKMRFFVLSDNILKFAVKLRDKQLGSFRFRVGNYRIIFDIATSRKEIVILKIARRDEIYK